MGCGDRSFIGDLTCRQLAAFVVRGKNNGTLGRKNMSSNYEDGDSVQLKQLTVAINGSWRGLITIKEVIIIREFLDAPELFLGEPMPPLQA